MWVAGNSRQRDAGGGPLYQSLEQENPIKGRADSDGELGTKTIAGLNRRDLERVERMEHDKEASMSHQCGRLDVDSDWFNAVIGYLILANALMLWLETDYRQYGVIWHMCETVFAVLFATEWLLRVHQHRCDFFNFVGIFDTVLASAGIINCIVLPLFRIPAFVVIRIKEVLQIVRVLRVMRVIKMFPILQLLASGCMKASKAVCCVGTIIGVVIYIAAVLLTRLLGQDHDPSLNSSEIVACWSGQCPSNMIDEEIHHYFGNVGRSMYTLFMVMTLCNWPLVVDVAKEKFPPINVAIIIYITITTYTLLSLVTAVICENMVSAVQNDTARKIADMEDDRAQFLLMLRDMFCDMDKDASGTLSKSEFVAALSQDNNGIIKKCATLGLDGVSEVELIQLYDMIDTDGGKSVNIEEFMGGFSRIRGPAKAKDVLYMSYGLKGVERHVKEFDKRLSRVEEGLAEMLAKLDKGM
eukprot:gnl/TRDRNA2_/TRDRNA2_202814_c0_seq1.p1 gnl/TRDRNA2_/TRDRNA2_202814_c0~~gnl/TRDRNA2_/TRDRNA2_202814_c0_seq1.p1  ORF type:complete len:469 (+),score=76.65 gnl/TRDRNA2_/TRDRNA2_202814_c0_seq1:102-1508(+)